MSNFITVRSVYGKIVKYYFNPCKNPKTGRWPDCVRDVDTNDNMILSDTDKNSGRYFIKSSDVIEVEDGTVFNLDNEIDAAKWAAIEHSSKIAKRRNERNAKGELIIDGSKKRYGSAELYIEIPGEESKIKNDFRKKKLTALNFIDGDSEQGKLLKTKLLGRDMSNSVPSDIEDYLCQQAEKNPDKIINLYTGGDTAVRLLFMEASDKKVIYRKQGVFMYGDNTALGATDEASITWMKMPQNKKLVDMIKRETFPELINDDKK